jgi:hypothetical protein
MVELGRIRVLAVRLSEELHAKMPTGIDSRFLQIIGIQYVMSYTSRVAMPRLRAAKVQRFC